MSKNCKQGSTLIAAIFIALILALTGATFLRVVRSSGNLETQAELEIRGLYAAESGLQTATRYLAQVGLTTGDYPVITSDARIEVNHLWVDVEAIVDPDYTGTLQAKVLHSRAWDAQTGGNFVKRVSWRIRELNAFEYGYFSNSVQSNGNKEVCDQNFFGDTYLTAKTAKMNLVCQNSNRSCGKFWGKVALLASSLGNGCDPDSLFVSGLVPLYTMLDAPIVVPENYQDLPQILRAKTGSGIIKLSGTGALVFLDDGTATFNGAPLGSIDGKIIATDSDISVSGTVLGNATVVSGPEKIITVSDNLVYADFVASTGNTPPAPPTAVPNNSDNFLGLVTDGGVSFDNTLKALHVNAAIVNWNIDSNQPPELSLVDNKTGNYGVTLTGSVLLSQAEKDLAPFTFVQDRRFLTRQPVGFPAGTNSENLFKFEISKWEESSVNN